jgi:hypothetical protein
MLLLQESMKEAKVSLHYITSEGAHPKEERRQMRGVKIESK